MGVCVCVWVDATVPLCMCVIKLIPEGTYKWVLTIV